MEDTKYVRIAVFWYGLSDITFTLTFQENWEGEAKKERGSLFSNFCRTLMSHTRQPFFLAAADALLATSWRRRTRQDVTQKASRRSLAAQIDFNFRFRDRLSFISLLDAPVPSPSSSLLVVP